MSTLKNLLDIYDRDGEDGISTLPSCRPATFGVEESSLGEG